MKTNKLTLGQKWLLALTTIPMLVFGALGGWGTYTNIASVFDRDATALGVVAAGEGATFVLALVMLSATVFGRPSPKMVRIGLWALPIAASGVSASTAPGLVEGIVFGVTPLGMVVSAEGLGYLARMVVIYQTGTDIEAQRRNAEIMRQIAYHNAKSQNHPDEDQRKASAEKAWKLAKKVGSGDAVLGSNMVDVQRVRMNQGADRGLVQMFGLSVPELSASDSADKDTQDKDSADNGQNDTRTERTPAVRPSTDKPSVRKYILGLLMQHPDMNRSDACTFVREMYGPNVKMDTFNKSFIRAQGDLAKIKAEENA